MAKEPKPLAQQPKHDILAMLGQLEALAQLALSMREIGVMVNIPQSTLYDYYTRIPEVRQALDKGWAFGVVKAQETIQQVVLSGKDLKTTRWYLQHRSDAFKRSTTNAPTIQVQTVGATTINLAEIPQDASIRVGAALDVMMGA